LKKTILLLLTLIPVFVTGQETPQDSIPKWKKSGTISLLINQAAFSNWTSGGENNVAATLAINYDINYYKKGWSWDTKIIGAYGVNKSANSSYYKKTDDRIEINSLLGKKFNKEWSYSSFLNFKTQFGSGYNYGTDENNEETRTLTSQFFSPAYLQLGIGLYWKKSNDLWVNIAPFTGQLTMVNNKFTRNLKDEETFFGVDRGNSARFELGASLKAFYKIEVLENVTLEHYLSLYSDYLEKAKNIDIDYTLKAVMKINDYLSTNLVIQTVYDDDAIKRVQLREIFGLGLTADLNKVYSKLSGYKKLL
jgi:hypothetical protein